MSLLFVIIEHGGRRLGISNATLDIEYDNSQQYNSRTRDIAIADPKHNPYLRTDSLLVIDSPPPGASTARLLGPVR